MEKEIKIKIDNLELIKSKFVNSLMKIEGYLKEAQGDMRPYNETTYGATGVYGRFKNVKEEFLKDLENFSKDIEIK